MERDSPPLAAVLELVEAHLPAHARVTNSYVIGLTPAVALDSGLSQLSPRHTSSV